MIIASKPNERLIVSIADTNIRKNCNYNKEMELNFIP